MPNFLDQLDHVGDYELGNPLVLDFGLPLEDLEYFVHLLLDFLEFILEGFVDVPGELFLVVEEPCVPALGVDVVVVADVILAQELLSLVDVHHLLLRHFLLLRPGGNLQVDVLISQVLVDGQHSGRVRFQVRVGVLEFRV